MIQLKEIQNFIENNFAGENYSGQACGNGCIKQKKPGETDLKKQQQILVVEYIQRVKIEAAKKSLEGSRKSINEVMFDVGYSDTKAFRTVFKKITGLSPVQYRNKYTNIVTA